MKLTLLCVPLTLRADVTGAARLARAHAERPSQPARPPLQGAEGAAHGACAGFSRLLPTPRPPRGAERCPRARPRCRRGAERARRGWAVRFRCHNILLPVLPHRVLSGRYSSRVSLAAVVAKIRDFVVIQAKVFLWAVAALDLAPKTKAPRGCAASAGTERVNEGCVM